MVWPNGLSYHILLPYSSGGRAARSNSALSRSQLLFFPRPRIPRELSRYWVGAMTSRLCRPALDPSVRRLRAYCYMAFSPLSELDSCRHLASSFSLRDARGFVFSPSASIGELSSSLSRPVACSVGDTRPHFLRAMGTQAGLFHAAAVVRGHGKGSYDAICSLNKAGRAQKRLTPQRLFEKANSLLFGSSHERVNRT